MTGASRNLIIPILRAERVHFLRMNNGAAQTVQQYFEASGLLPLNQMALS